MAATHQYRAGFMKRILRTFVVSLLLLPLIALTWLMMSESGLHWTYKNAYQYAQAYLPGQLKISKLEGRLMGPITVMGLAYEHDGTQVSADQITLEWLPFALLSTTVNISRLHVSSLHIVLPQTDFPQSENTDKAFSLPDIHLPWRVTLKDVEVDDFTFNQHEQSVGLDKIRLSASSLFSQVDIDQLSIKANDFNLNIHGELQLANNYLHELNVSWQAKLPSSAVIKGNGQLAGSLATTSLKQRLTGPLQLTLDAELTNLLNQVDWQARANVTNFDAQKLGPTFPAIKGNLQVEGKGDLGTATVFGSMDGQYPDLGPFDARFNLLRLEDSSIQIDHLLLHTPNNDRHLQARGQWFPGADGGDIALALSWQNLRWPLEEGTWFDSAIGSGWIEGNIHHYQLGLATDRLWSQAPPSFWYASANGNLDGLDFHSLRITTLNGEALTSGQLNWSPQLTWQAQLSASHINPAEYLPVGADWPGQINAKLTSSGRVENGQMIADADITQLTGTLRGYSVSLRSRLGWNKSGLDIHLLDFHSGKNQLSAQGRIGDTLKLDWSVAAEDLAELHPQAQGKLHAKGRLTGPRTTPTIQTTFNGQALNLPDYAIGQLDGRLNMDMLHWQKIDIKLTAEALALKGIELQSLDISSTEQRMEAKAVSENITALLELRGKADGQGWQGHIKRADFNSQQFHNWQLRAPAELRVSADTLEVKPICWLSNDSDVCVVLQKTDENWKAKLDGNHVPLMLLSPWLPADMKLEGVANTKADILVQTNRISGEANIQLPAGVVSYPLLEGERDRWEYHAGSISIALTDKGIKAKSEMAMSSGELFNFKAELPAAQLLSIDRQHQPLHAEAHLQIHDLGLIEALIPEIQNLQGEVALNLAADGTLAQPKFSGQAELINGGFRIPRLGLGIEKITLKGRSDSFEKLHFHLNAHSGEGDLAVQGQTILDKNAGWPTKISIKGKEFEVSRIPEARVLVSPDLQINAKQHNVDIKGNIHIPIANLQPKDLTTAARVSEDVVIVGSEPSLEKKWSIFTNVRVTLGERVNFYGFGFDGRLGGSLLLQDEPGQLTKATGEISIPEGNYRAYGQRLNVENGRLLYTGGPLTNPGLDLRAVRIVNNVTAGLSVRGSLSQPQIELFSIPAMGQTDALSYLMLGRPIENASGEEGAMMAKATLALGLSGGNRLARSLTEQFGLDEMRVESSEGNQQASLVMGRYLSPKLYVSYGVGLIEAFNTLTLRYQISDKWQLKGESGEYQGADIFYTIER